MKGHRSLLCSYKDTVSDPADTRCYSWRFAIVEGYVDSFVPYQTQIIQGQNDLRDTFNFHCSQSLNVRRTVVDILLLAVTVVAEQIAATHHVDKLVIDVEILCVLELQVEELVIIDEVEATQLVARQQQYFGSGEAADGLDVSADGEGGCLCLRVGYELIGCALVDEGGAGYADDGGYFGLVGEFVGPAVLEHDYNQL